MNHLHIEIDFILLYIVFWAAVLGAVMGSFLDCVAWRRAHGESIWKGRSHCGECGHVLGVRDLIPVFSFLFSKGKCRHCGARIPREAFVAELVGAFSFTAIAVKFDMQLTLPMWLIFAALLLLLALIDCNQRMLPDSLLLALAVNRLLFWLVLGHVPGALLQMLLGACSVSVPLLLLVLLMDRVLGKETMGGGDIKLFFVLGLYFTWQQMLLVLLCACLLGIAGWFLARRTPRTEDGEEQAFPFGPYIAGAAGIVLLWGQPLINWYMSLLEV